MKTNFVWVDYNPEKRGKAIKNNEWTTKTQRHEVKMVVFKKTVTTQVSFDPILNHLTNRRPGAL
jgi:hypothetical protein